MNTKCLQIITISILILGMDSPSWGDPPKKLSPQTLQTCKKKNEGASCQCITSKSVIQSGVCNKGDDIMYCNCRKTRPFEPHNEL
jgi:hypothetical protein